MIAAVLLLVIVGVAASIALVVVCTIALGPFFWVPYLVVYLLLRASGLTPKTFNKKKPAKWAVALFGEPPNDEPPTAPLNPPPGRPKPPV